MIGNTFEVPTHEEALSNARKDIREALNQYASIADPTERAARRERVRIAEESGEVEETAKSIATNVLNLNGAPEQTENIV